MNPYALVGIMSGLALIALSLADRWWRGWGLTMIVLAWAVFLFFVWVLEPTFPELWGPCGAFRSDRAWTCSRP